MSRLASRAVLSAAVLTVGIAAVVYAATRESNAPRGESAESWAALAPSPLSRTEVGAARVGDRIYVVGGFASTGGTTGDLAIYDISENAWSRGAALPIGVNHPGVTAYEGRVYLLGGNLGAREGREPKSQRLYSYDPASDRWKRLPDASIQRAALGLVALDGRLYAAGGYSEANQQLRTLEIYDIKKRRWRRAAPMPTGRNHVGSAALGGRIYVTGGRPGDVHGGLAVVERYDPRRNRWSTVAPMETARSGHAAVTTGGRLIVFGGEELDGGTTIEQVEAYEPGTDSWTELPEMVTPRHGLGGAGRQGRVYAIEGGPQPGLAYSRALEYLDVD